MFVNISSTYNTNIFEKNNIEKPPKGSRLSQESIVINYLKYFIPDVKIGISSKPGIFFTDTSTAAFE